MHYTMYKLAMRGSRSKVLYYRLSIRDSLVEALCRRPSTGDLLLESICYRFSIRLSMRNSLSQKLKNANFFSIFFDGATDNSTKDQECFYVLLFDPNSTEKGKCDKIEVSLNRTVF